MDYVLPYIFNSRKLQGVFLRLFLLDTDRCPDLLLGWGAVEHLRVKYMPFTAFKCHGKQTDGVSSHT